MNTLYFSAKETADLLGISRQRLGVLLRSGRIQGAFNAGKHVGWQIPKQSLLTPIMARYGACGNIGTKMPDEDVAPAERKRAGRPRKQLDRSC